MQNNKQSFIANKIQSIIKDMIYTIDCDNSTDRLDIDKISQEINNALQQYFKDKLRKIKKQRDRRIKYIQRMSSINDPEGNIHFNDLIDKGREKCIREMAKDFGIELRKK